MNRPRILQPGTNYTFSKYFELPYAPADRRIWLYLWA